MVAPLRRAPLSYLQTGEAPVKVIIEATSIEDINWINQVMTEARRRGMIHHYIEDENHVVVHVAGLRADGDTSL